MPGRIPVRVLVAVLLLAGGGFAQAQDPTVQPPPPVTPAPPLPVPAPQPVPEPALVAPPETPSPPAPEEKAEPEKKAAPAKPPEPQKRARSTTAILQAIDKVTAESLRFEAPIGRAVRYKTLVFTVRACETAAPDELAPEASAYVVIDSQPKAQPGRTAPPGRQIFRGWMFASSPGLNPVQHPVYDAWLIACKTADPSPAKR